MSAAWLQIGVPSLVAILAVAALALFVLGSLVGRWPLWLAGFLVAVAALLVAFLAPHPPPPSDRATPAEGPTRVSAWPAAAADAILWAHGRGACGSDPGGTGGRAPSPVESRPVPERDASRRENPIHENGPWRAIC